MNPIISTSSHIIVDFKSFFRVYKDNTIKRYIEPEFLPPSEHEHPKTNVLSIDITIPPQNNVSARIYLPKNTTQKLPLLFYIHGGGFCIESAFSSLYHPYMNNLVAQANVMAVSVEYRLAPEHALHVCYDDSWSVLKWVVSGLGSDHVPWLRDHADFSRVFLAGDSAGANICHEMMVRASDEGLNLEGVVLVHPFFGDGEFDDLWVYLGKGSNMGVDDPRLNPVAHPRVLSKIGCGKILVCTGGSDGLRHCGWSYYEALRESGWRGEVEIEETEGEDHVFHLKNPGCDKAGILMKKMADFLK